VPVARFMRRVLYFCYTVQELKLQRLGVKITPSSPVARTKKAPTARFMQSVLYFYMPHIFR